MKKQQNLISNFKYQQNQNKPSVKKCIKCGLHENILKICGGLRYMCKVCYAKLNDDNHEFQNLKFQKEKSVDFVIQGIYLGNQAAAIDQQTFNKHDISAVLVCGRHLITPFLKKYQYKIFNIGDSHNQKIITLFDQSHQWIKQLHNKKKNILIHCAEGVSRSASFTIAYIMKEYKMTYTKAFDFVKQKRKKINPNPGFVKQLLQYQKKQLLAQQKQNQSKKTIK